MRRPRPTINPEFPGRIPAITSSTSVPENEEIDRSALDWAGWIGQGRQCSLPRQIRARCRGPLGFRLFDGERGRIIGVPVAYPTIHDIQGCIPMLKRSSILPCLLSALFAHLAVPFAQTAVAPSGSGSAADPYRIATLENLRWLSETPDAWDDTIMQTADIDAAGTATWDEGRGFMPIGRGPAFRGVYHGKGHSISGLTVHRDTMSGVGLFSTATGAKIDSVGLIDASIRGLDDCGALLGSGLALVAHSYATGRVECSGDFVGGLIGGGSDIEESFAHVDVKGHQYVGGLTGLCGPWATIRNSFAMGAVDGALFVGGLVGETRMVVQYSYASGRVTGEYAGGLIGQDRSVADSCHWGIETSGLAKGSGDGPPLRASVTGLTSAAMRQRNSFVGWDFDNIWTIDEGKSYPTLRRVPRLPTVPTSVAPRLQTKLLAPGAYPLELFDVQGARVWAGEARWTGARWVLPELRSGAWVLRARTGRGIVVERLARLP